jgi:hypothetical protein
MSFVRNSGGYNVDITDDPNCPYEKYACYNRKLTKSTGNNPGRWYYIDQVTGDFFSWCDDPKGAHTHEIVQKGGRLGASRSVNVQTAPQTPSNPIMQTPSKHINTSSFRNHQQPQQTQTLSQRNIVDNDLVKIKKLMDDHTHSINVLHERIGGIEDRMNIILDMLKDLHISMDKLAKAAEVEDGKMEIVHQ